MTYLSIVSDHLKKIDGYSLKRGAVIGRGTHGIITTIGKTHDGIDIVLKESGRNSSEVDSFPFQLAFLSHFYEMYPDQRSILPQFIGLLRSSKGKALGIIMDRFGVGTDIQNFRPHSLEVSELKRLLEKIGFIGVDEDRISTSLFNLSSHARLGDLMQLSVKAIDINGKNRTFEQNNAYNLAWQLRGNLIPYSVNTGKLKSTRSL